MSISANSILPLAANSRQRFTVPEGEIAELAEVGDLLPSLKAQPVETSIAGPDFREQLVDVVAGSRPSFILLRDRTYRFGDPESGSMYVEIGAASPLFFNY